MDANHNGRRDAGDRIDFTYRLKNTGPVRVTGLRLTDAAGGPITCTVSALAPGGQVTCYSSRTLSQSDINRGRLSSAAKARGVNSANGAPVGASGSSTVTWNSVARLTLVQTAQLTSDPGGDGVPNEGDGVTYRFTVTNAGAVALRSVRINNALLKRLGSTISCASTTLEPQSSTTCVSTPLRITRTQAVAGKTVSKAGATALTATGDVVRSNSTQTSLTVRRANASGAGWLQRDGNRSSGVKAPRAFAKLSMSQSLHSVVDTNQNAVLDRGESVRYAFRITNVGSLSVSGIKVDDAKLAKLKVNIPCASTTLAPGQSTVCVSAPLVLTEFQAREGIGANFATGQGTVAGVIVKSNLTSMTVPKRIAGAQPAIAAPVAPLDFGEGLFSAGPSEVSALSDADRTAASLTKPKTNFDSGTLGMLGGGLLAGGLLLASVTKVVVKRRKPVIHLPGADS